MRGRLFAALVASMALVAALILMSGSGAAAGGEQNITTAGYGNLRDNWDPHESALSPAAVQSASFGQIFSTSVKGSVYGQPLVYDGKLIVTTEQADAYALNPTTGAVLWTRSFGNAFKSSTIKCSDLKPYLGSTSTPVIDESTGTIYMTTRLVEGASKLSDAHWYLQAVSAATGAEVPGYPVEISGTPENTPGVPFNEAYEAQRPALLLLNGVVYIAFGSDCDITPYRGIVVGVSTATHKITTMWSDESGVGTGEDSQAGIWQSGGGPVSDIPGRVILATGNGVSPSPAPSNEPPPTLSESVVGLTVQSNGTLKPTQFFAPSNAPNLDQNDEDLGSGGPIALPTEYFGTSSIPHLLVESGKDGRVFLINADKMGGYRQGAGGTDAVLQSLGPYVGIWGHPAAYGGQGGWVYIAENAGGGYLQALHYGLSGKGVPQLTPEGDSPEVLDYTTGSPLVTSNGTQEGSAVVWVESSTASGSGKGAELRAYSAMPSAGTLSLLWSAPIGKGVKFGVPTAYEGRVYVGTRDGHVLAFGSSAQAPLQGAPLTFGSVPVGQSSTATLSVSATRPLTITGPVTAGGERVVSATEPAPAVKPARGLTAGPRTPAPKGTAALTPSEMTVLGEPRPGTAIAAGGTLHLRIRFAPGHAGPIQGLVSIRTSAGTRTISVTGYGTKPGLLASSPPLKFGSVTTRTGGRTLSLTIANSWSQPERLTSFRLPSGPFKVSGLPAAGTVLEPRRTVTLALHFEPRYAGRYGSRLGISSDHGSLEIPIDGQARVGSPRLAVNTTHLNFGAVALGHAKSLTFYVSDTGTAPLVITRSIAPEGPFGAPVALPEGIVIENGLYATVTVSFKPTVAGPAEGTYVLNANDGRGYVRVHLTGRGG